MNKRKILKVIVGGAAAFGAGAITYAVVRNNIAPPKLVGKITVGIATFAIAGLVGNAAADQCEVIIDDSFDFVDNLKQSYKDFVAQLNGTADVEPDAKQPGDVEPEPVEA